MMEAREAMERLNAEAGRLNIWLRTQANAPAQRPEIKELFGITVEVERLQLLGRCRVG